MTTLLTPEEITALAPDAAAAKAGQSQANPRKWPTLGRSDAAAWGECQGSGKSPYKTKVDLTDFAYSCSCPSRKLPCKHTLGLLFLLHEQPAAFSASEPPAWVGDWLAQRARCNEQQQAKRAPAAADAAPAARQPARTDRRHARTAAGLQELEIWLRDLVRQGLASVQGRSRKFWEEPAARMVDAQAPGVARQLRAMAGLPATGADWPEHMLAQIGRLYLLRAGFQRWETLPAATQADIATTLGWPQSQDEVRDGLGVRDRWQVVGQRIESEDRLRARFTWLWGYHGRRAALLLDYAFGGQPFEKAPSLSSCFDAELAFFAGAYPLRALVKTQIGECARPAERPGYADFAAAFDAYAAALAASPWIDRFPLLLNGVIPLHNGADWLLCDRRHTTLPCAPGGAPYWSLLAQSGGRPIDVFGEWNGRWFVPLNAWE